MVAFHWTVKDNHLAIANESTVLSLSAEEVYEYWNGGSFGSFQLQPLEIEIPNLRRSKIGASLKARVSFDLNEKCLWLHILGVRKNTEHVLSFEKGRIIDQGIEDGQWFYVSGDIPTLERILEAAENAAPGPITIR